MSSSSSTPTSGLPHSASLGAFPHAHAKREDKKKKRSRKKKRFKRPTRELYNQVREEAERIMSNPVSGNRCDCTLE